MNKEEKSLLNELFEAAGLNSEKQPEKQKEPKIEEKPPINEDIEKKDQVSEEKQENTDENKENKPKTEVKDHATAKKDIKFLVIYTIVFVIVISSLIAGSYAITSRIHQQMAENNQDLNSSQSTLKNIQDENTSLKKENAALKVENEALSTSAKDAHALLESVGDMVEHDGYLAAAQNAYIDGERTQARKLMAAIDRDKLSQPAKEYYDLLKDKLGL